MPFFSHKKFNTAAAEQPLVGMFVYSIVGFIRPAIFIFLLPLYLESFTKAEYGIYDLMLITGGFLTVIGTFRLNAAMLTQYYDYIGDDAKKQRFLSSLFSFSCLLAFGFAVLGYLLGEFCFDLVFKSEELQFFPCGFIILLYAVLGEINACYFIFLKNEKSLAKYVFIILFQILLVIILQIICIIWLKLGVTGALGGMLAANILTTLCILIMEKGILTLRPDMSMVRIALKFSVALIPYLLIYWALTKGGKIVLENFSDLETAGVFAVLITIASIVMVVVEAVVNGIRPFLFEIFAEGDKGNKQKVSLFTSLIVNVPLLAVPVIILVGSNIGLLTTKDSYLEVGDYICFACAVTFLLVYSKLFYQQLIFVKKSQNVTNLSFIVLLVLIAGLLLWVPSLHIWGVLLATGLANIVMGLLFYFSAQGKLFVDYNRYKILVVPAVIFSLLFLLEWICIKQLDISRQLFGLLQFVILSSLILIFNYKTLKQYKSLFIA